MMVKYANSLGRKFDAPDIATKITLRQGSNRQAQQERLLNPDEVLSSVLGTYYPGGQTIEEALVIDAPTGNHSDYLPLIPETNALVPPSHPPSSPATASPPSNSILPTDVVPLLPLPGSLASRDTSDSPTTTLNQAHNMPGTLISLLLFLFSGRHDD
jgi:osomolarity two-component system response regulator SSK1